MTKFRFAAVLGAAAVMLGALPQISVSAATECYDDQGVRYSLDTSKTPATATVIGVKTSVTEITIPETVTLYEAGVPYQAKVNGIADYGLSRSNLKTAKISIPITSVPKGTFYLSESLTSVNLPETVTTIEDYAFDTCKSLTSVNLSKNLTEIGRGAFSETALTDLSILKNTSVQTIKYSAFSICDKLTSAVVPDTVTHLDVAFANNKALKTVKLPQNPKYTEILPKTFQGCTALTSITIPDNITKIDEYAFQACISLTELRFPKSVTEIGYRAFHNCESLKDIYIYNPGCTIGNNLIYSYISDTAPRLTYFHAVKGSTTQTYVEDYSVDGALSHGTDYGYRFVELGTEIDNYGDFDNNGKIDLSDAQNVLNYSVMLSIGIVDGTDTDTIMACDVDRDGEVTITDAQLVLMYYVLNDVTGIPTSWSDLVK